jgi:hypothetical protein
MKPIAVAVGMLVFLVACDSPYREPSAKPGISVRSSSVDGEGLSLDRPGTQEKSALPTVRLVPPRQRLRGYP